MGSDDLLQPDDRIRFIGFVDNLLKPVMGNDVEPIHCRDASAFPVRQTQTTTDRLLNQNARIGGAERHNRVEIRRPSLPSAY